VSVAPAATGLMATDVYPALAAAVNSAHATNVLPASVSVPVMKNILRLLVMMLAYVTLAMI
jgi:hypothetical protein